MDNMPKYTPAPPSIEAIQKRAVASLDFQGAMLYLVRVSVNSDFLKDWYCGYVVFHHHPLKSDHYFKGIAEWLPVHGGITYGGHDCDWSIYGFDCAHVDDEYNDLLKDQTFLLEECMRMKIAVEIASKYEDQFDKSDDFNEKIIIIDQLIEECMYHAPWHLYAPMHLPEDSFKSWEYRLFAHDLIDIPEARWAYQVATFKRLFNLFRK